MPVSVDVQEELLRELLGADEIRLHGLGGGTRTFRIAATGRLITVGLDWPAERRPEADLDREALLLRRVTGIIDWSDAAITDPAVDFGRLLRDLGPAALDRAMTTYARHGGDPECVAPRVGFYAACGLIEDLAFGLVHSRTEYVDKTMTTWDSIFTATLRSAHP